MWTGQCHGCYSDGMFAFQSQLSSYNIIVSTNYGAKFNHKLMVAAAPYNYASIVLFTAFSTDILLSRKCIYSQNNIVGRANNVIYSMAEYIVWT